MAELFGYTQAKSSLVNTGAFQVNQAPNLSTAKAIEAVGNLLQTGIKVQKDLEDKNKEGDLIKAAEEANLVRDYLNDNINKTNNAYEKEQLVNQTETALDSIIVGYGLEGKYKNSFQASHREFMGSQRRNVDKLVYQQRIDDVTASLDTTAGSVIDAPASDLIDVVNGYKEAYKSINVPVEDSEEYIQKTLIGKKVANLLKKPEDLLNVDLTKLQADINDLTKTINPKLINKEYDLQINAKVRELKKLQKDTVTERVNNIMDSEATSLKDFNKQIDEYSHILKPLEIANYKEEKANKVYQLGVTRKTRKLAEETEANEVTKGVADALLKTAINDKEIDRAIDMKLEIGDYKSEEEANLYRREAKQKLADEIEKRKESSAKKELDAQKKVATNEINRAKNKSDLKGATHPDVMKNYVIIKGNSKEDEAFLNEYTFRYNIDNNTKAKTDFINGSSTKYIGDPVTEKGAKYSAKKLINEFYPQENFSAEAIIKLHMNHQVKGDIGLLLDTDFNNESTAMDAIGKFNALKTYNRDAAKSLLGDKMFYKLEAASNLVTKNEKGEFVFTPNNLRKIQEISNNPVKVNLDPLYEAVKEDPTLIYNKEEYSIIKQMNPDKDGEDIIAEIKARKDQETPIDGVMLKGYNKFIVPDDMEKVKTLPKAVTFINGNFTGVAFNPAEKRFYYSTQEDVFAEPIAFKDEKGNLRAYSELTGVDGVYTAIQNELFKRYQGTMLETATFGYWADKISETESALSQWVLSFNPKQITDKNGDTQVLYTDAQKEAWATRGEYIPLVDTGKLWDAFKRPFMAEGSELKVQTNPLGSETNPYASSSKIPNSKKLSGEDAVAKLKELEGNENIPERYLNIAREEGFVDGYYKDDKGVVTYGFGQTGKYIKQKPLEVMKKHENIIKKNFTGYDTLPENTKTELLSLGYRGDVLNKKGKALKWVGYFNNKEYLSAAMELLDHNEYRQRLAKNPKGDGVTKRLEKASLHFLQLALDNQTVK